MPAREKYSKNVGVFQTEAGQLNEAVHLWAYKDLNDRAAVRSKVLQDPEWQVFLGKSAPCLAEMKSIILNPAPHSPDEVRTPRVMDIEARQVLEMGYGGAERITMNMGPQHPSSHGVFRAILTLEGETVIAIDAVIGYLHRCHEKLSETLTYTQYPSIASKTDYVAAMTSELAYVRAAETIGKIDVPRRAQYLRVIAAELQRVASHCLWLGTWCLDMGGALGGGATVFLYCIREREDVLDLFESLTGARLLYGLHQVGGVRYDIPAGWAQQVPRRPWTRSTRRIDEFEEMLESQRVLHGPDPGRGRGLARAGAGGRHLRAAPPRLRRQLRHPPGRARTPPTGTSTSRCPSRRRGTASRATGCGWSSSASPSRSSARRSTGCPKGPISSRPGVKSVGQVRIPKGEAYARVEGARGEVGCYLIADGGAKPYRMKWRGASFSNLALLPHIIPGHKVADVVAIMGSVDPVFGEVDR